MSLFIAGEVDQTTFKRPFQLKWFYELTSELLFAQWQDCLDGLHLFLAYPYISIPTETYKQVHKILSVVNMVFVYSACPESMFSLI